MFASTTNAPPPAPCLRCGYNHRYQFPDGSDYNKHEGSETACINTLLGRIKDLEELLGES